MTKIKCKFCHRNMLLQVCDFHCITGENPAFYFVNALFCTRCSKCHESPGGPNPTKPYLWHCIWKRERKGNPHLPCKPPIGLLPEYFPGIAWHENSYRSLFIWWQAWKTTRNTGGEDCCISDQWASPRAGCMQDIQIITCPLRQSSMDMWHPVRSRISVIPNESFCRLHSKNVCKNVCTLCVYWLQLDDMKHITVAVTGLGIMWWHYIWHKGCQGCTQQEYMAVTQSCLLAHSQCSWSNHIFYAHISKKMLVGMLIASIAASRQTIILPLI